MKVSLVLRFVNGKNNFAYEATQLLTLPLQFMTCDHVLDVSRYARHASSLWPRNSAQSPFPIHMQNYSCTYITKLH